MIYQISDMNGEYIDAEGVEEMRRMMDKQLCHDLNEYVVKTGKIGGMVLLCVKYQCSLSELTEKMEEINRRSLAELGARWEAFKAERREFFQPDDAAVQLT